MWQTNIGVLLIIHTVFEILTSNNFNLAEY